jgi:predicted DCC family thiol-disulfide oxidoreductase YuxK
MMSSASTSKQVMAAAVLVYDGDCPVCSNYVLHSRLKERFPDIRLVSARENDPAVAEARKCGIDLNEDMALWWNGNWMTGSEAMLEISRHGAPGVLERGLLLFLGRGAQSAARYRVLVRLRKLLLRLLGRQEIAPRMD